MLTRLSVIVFFVLFTFFARGQNTHVFKLGKNDFLLDGKSFQIISGEMHPARIPRQYWRHRIQMAKAMGCNTIAVYVFWNYHEEVKGSFDFTSTNHDIAAFIRICQEEKMWVLLRPGPYVCGEWDFGGIPYWLLKTPDIKLRCMDTVYMAAVHGYISRLSKEIRPLLCSQGGPILLVQLENEYGSFANDKNYLQALKNDWIQNGIDGPFYTADGPTPFMLEAGGVPGAAIGLDSGSGDDDFAQASKQNPDVPSFSSETYPGWLTHWKEKWAKPDTISLKNDLKYLLSHKKSFNLYVVHGGTNFGFTAGANAFAYNEYSPDVTSYDYDAPINEQGLPTAKFFMIRDLIEKYTGHIPPPVPDPVPSIDIPDFTMTPFNSIWNILPEPIAAVQPKPMEYYDQNQGLILYRTKLIGHKTGSLTITEPHDYAIIYIDGKRIDTIFRGDGKWTIELPPAKTANPTLDILVEGMGHINFAQFLIDRKGITDRVTLNGMTLMNWETYLLPLNESFIAALKNLDMKTDIRGGNFFKGEFNLNKTGDTYFDLSKYKKGVVYVNGHNLGRFWNTGPQFQLYCPAPWLKTGVNHVVVFDFNQTTAATIDGVMSPQHVHK
jgi:beta-galactosidase